MSKVFYERYWKCQDILSDFPYKWPIVKKLLPPNSQLKLLDFGCGTGHLLKEVVKIRPDYRIYGVDISTKALEVAKTRVPRGVFRFVSNDQHIPFPNNSFDIILALDVLEHIYDTKTVFTELARVLKPNGMLIITVPYNGKLKLILATLVAFDGYFNPYSPHIRFFNKSTLRRCLTDAKLSPLRFGYFGRFYPLSNGMYAIATKR
ncbi:MAG: hypothetical protein UY10_C0059G0002 [Microgenomates group bacterium GW2011_GWA2_47_8]|nr:MAG: hypothetical protein UY10_C0059G0002 [Microgenomates group bacterium GW2011_GWA2_47_8]